MDLMSVQHKNAARDEGTKHSFAHCLSSSTCEQTCWLVRSAFQNRSVHNRVTASSCTAASHWCEACYLRVLYGLSGITAVKQFEFVTCDHLLSCRIKLADWCHIRSSRIPKSSEEPACRRNITCSHSLRQIMAASGRYDGAGTAPEPPSGFWVFLTAGSHKHGKSVLKKLKDLATIVTQRVTSVMLISILLNTILVPSLENIVAPACKKLTMGGAASVAGYCWLQSSSARGRSMKLQKKKSSAVDVCNGKQSMYRASLAKLAAAYCDAACRYRKPIEDFAELMPSARKGWMSIHFPDSDVSFGGVKASLAKAENDADKHFKAWQTANKAVEALEADIVTADAAANVAEDKQQSYYQAALQLQNQM